MTEAEEPAIRYVGCVRGGVCWIEAVVPNAPRPGPAAAEFADGAAAMAWLRGRSEAMAGRPR